MSIQQHSITTNDLQAVAQMKAMFAGAPKLNFTPASREFFDGIMSQTPASQEVAFHPGELGGVRGWWLHPTNARKGAAVLYLHGGGYVIGSAYAYRNFVSQIAARAGAVTFVADYALAPEARFPAAHEELRFMINALAYQGFDRVALVGDSAGGGLALSVLTDASASTANIVGIAAISPWIDISVSGASAISNDAADLILSKETLVGAAATYLGSHRKDDPRLPTLIGDFVAKVPVLIHVGGAEILRDDAVRYAAKADKAGVKASVHVWEGMQHVFPSSFAMLEAGAAALDDIGAFLVKSLN